MAKKKEETKKAGVAKQPGKDGLGVTESIANILRKSKKAMTRVQVIKAMKKNFPDKDCSSTVNVQLGAKVPCMLAISQGMHIEIEIVNPKPVERSYKFIGDADEDEVAEWKADVKERKAAAKAAKEAKEAAEESSEVDDSQEDAPEMTKKEKKAAKKAAKKAKKAAKKNKK